MCVTHTHTPTHTPTHTHAHTHTLTLTHTHTRAHTNLSESPTFISFSHCLAPSRVGAREDCSVRIKIEAFRKPRVFNPVSQMFLQCHLRNSSSVCLVDSGPHFVLSKLFGNHSIFHAFLLRAVDDMMSLALCGEIVFQTSRHFRSHDTQATCDSCPTWKLFACSLTLTLTPACLGQVDRKMSENGS